MVVCSGASRRAWAMQPARPRAHRETRCVSARFKVTLKTPEGEKQIECDEDTYVLDAAEVRPRRDPGQSARSSFGQRAPAASTAPCRQHKLWIRSITQAQNQHVHSESCSLQMHGGASICCPHSAWQMHLDVTMPADTRSSPVTRRST
jgi:hypothetical protein